MPKLKTSIAFDPALKRRLEHEAAKTGATWSALLAKIASDWLDARARKDKA